MVGLNRQLTHYQTLNPSPATFMLSPASAMAAAAAPTLKPFSGIPFPSRTLSPLRISYPAAATGRRASFLSFPKSPAFVSLFARASDLAAPPPVESGEAAVFDEGFDWGEPEARLSEWEAEEEEGGSSGREQLPAEPSEDAKLFVGNLPFDVESEDLAELFDKAGTVEIAEVIYNRDTDRSRGFGFVTMGSVEEAEKAVDMFNSYDINGRLIIVNKAAPRGSRVQQPRVFERQFRLYVGNLPWQVDNARLEQVFSEHGKVLEARVVYDRDTGRSRGFGFVIMSSQTELDDAIAALDGQGLDGRSMRVSIAEERPRRGGY